MNGRCSLNHQEPRGLATLLDYPLPEGTMNTGIPIAGTLEIPQAILGRVNTAGAVVLRRRRASGHPMIAADGTIRRPRGRRGSEAMQRDAATVAAVILAVSMASLASAANTPPSIASFPALNVATVVADNATDYTVTMTVSDPDGYNNLRDARTLFNFTEAGGTQTNGRGYLAWGPTDADITRYGGTWVLV
jgi:hypothetical protein